MLAAPHGNVEKGGYAEFKCTPALSPNQIKARGKKKVFYILGKKKKFSTHEIGTKNIMCVTII